jgi:hypothetical protein
MLAQRNSTGYKRLPINKAPLGRQKGPLGTMPPLAALRRTGFTFTHSLVRGGLSYFGPYGPLPYTNMSREYR